LTDSASEDYLGRALQICASSSSSSLHCQPVVQPCVTQVVMELPVLYTLWI